MFSFIWLVESWHQWHFDCFMSQPECQKPFMFHRRHRHSFGLQFVWIWGIENITPVFCFHIFVKGLCTTTRRPGRISSETFKDVHTMTYLQNSSKRSSMLVSSMLLLTISEKGEVSHGLTRGWGDEKSRRSYKTDLSTLGHSSSPSRPMKTTSERVPEARDCSQCQTFNNEMDDSNCWGYFTEDE